MAFLNESGLDRLWQNIIAKLNKKMADLDDNLEKKLEFKMDKQNPSGFGSFRMNPDVGEPTVGAYSSTLGFANTAIATGANAEGMHTSADGEGSHTEGNGTKASGEYSHAEGMETEVTGIASHTEGWRTKASGIASHAEGQYAEASGDYSHAEGNSTRAQGKGSHAEGTASTAIGDYSHAEGWNSFANAKYSHAEGYYTYTDGENSHSEGYRTGTRGKNSHAEGSGTKALSSDQHVQGRYNIVDENEEYAHIVGNGQPDYNDNFPELNPIRSNIHTLDWEGNAWYSGDVYVGSTSGTNKDEGSKKLATEEFVNTALKSAAVVQSDWEQNDSTADDYIKNRPFYTQNGRVALVDNLTRENYENGTHPTCNFVPGQSYDVVCDDILYENIICIEDDGWNVILGDTFYIDDDGGNGLYIEGFEEDWSTLSIFTTQETVKKIDEKYLPNVRKVLKLYTCYSEDADDGRAGGTPALAPDKILRAGLADWEDYVTVEPLANADDIVIFEGQTKVGVPANITFCTRFNDYYNTSTEYAIITFYSEHEGKIRTMWSRESNLNEYLATQDYVDAEISKISAISLTENLTDPEKQQVRDNIGAGTSNFSGSYNDLTDKPDLGQQELITPEDIDVICGQSIELASEVLL